MDEKEFVALDIPREPDFTYRFQCDACGKNIRVDHFSDEHGLHEPRERVEQAARDFHLLHLCAKRALRV